MVETTPPVRQPGSPPARTPWADYCRYRDAMKAMRDAEYEAWVKRITESAR